MPLNLISIKVPQNQTQVVTIQLAKIPGLFSDATLWSQARAGCAASKTTRNPLYMVQLKALKSILLGVKVQ